MENIVVAIIAGITSFLVALIGLFGGKKLGKKSSTINYKELVSTLKDTLMAQTERIKLLEDAHDEQIEKLKLKDDEIADLKRRVSNLEQLTVEQASIIIQLTKGTASRLPKHKGGEVNTDEDHRV